MVLMTGGGIVYDSDPYEEYIETLNKLKSNITTIQNAEEMYARLQMDAAKLVTVNGEEHQDPSSDPEVFKSTHP